MIPVQFIKTIPAIRALLPLCAGIIISIHCKQGEKYTLLLLSIVVLCILILLVLQRCILRPFHSWLKGVLVFFSFVFLGFLNVCFYPAEKDLPESLKKGYWICKVEDFPLTRSKSYKVILRSEGVFFNNNYIKRREKLLTYFEKDSLCEKFYPGDLLLIDMQPVRPDQPGNPGEFNYREYLYRNGIYYQAFIKSYHWRYLGKERVGIHYFSKMIRNKYIYRIREKMRAGEEFGIIAALSTGNKDFLDENIRNSYSETGAMHVLAVSGLHVGLVWYVLDLIFRGLKNFRVTSSLYYILMTGILWLYVLITGMSASVTRAAIMLSMVIISGIFKRGSVISNPVFLSAFILLIINPFYLFDVGFQLSYMAVLGILFFQPRLNKLFHSNNVIFSYLLELTSVSLAAQAGTCVLSIFYFNKFPTYFLLTNLIVIPLVTFILILIIISVFFWYSDFLFSLITKMEAFFTSIMNKGVMCIESLPGSSLHDIYFDRADMLFLFFFYVFLHLFIVNKSLLSLKYLLISLAFFFLYGGLRDILRRSDTFTILYNIRGILAFEIVDEGYHYFISSGITKEKQEQITRTCKNFWLMRNLPEPVFIDIEKADISYERVSVISSEDKKITVLINRSRYFVIINNFKDDCNYDLHHSLSPDLVVINSGGILRIPSCVSISDSCCIAVSSGIQGKLIIPDAFISKERKGNFMDVRSGKAMIRSFLNDSAVFFNVAKYYCLKSDIEPGAGM